jgi:hypothetical protein
MRRRDANASTALVAPICHPRWNQLRGPTLGANLMARFPSPKANLPSGTNPGLDEAGVFVGARRRYHGAQLALDAQPFSAPFLTNKNYGTRIAAALPDRGILIAARHGKCGRHRVTELQHPTKILSMPRFGLEKAPMRLRELWCTEGDGPGRCERGDRGHDRDRAFREKGYALYPICRRCGIKTLLTMGPGAGLF